MAIIDISITAPSSAKEGEKVSLSVLLKNVSSYNYMFKTEIYAVPELFPDFRIGTIEKNINSGSSFTAYGSFIMPACKTTIFIWVERLVNGSWSYTGSGSKIVSLEAAVPEYRGSIAKKELEYNESRALIPASNIPQGERGLIHVVGRNDMTTKQKLGIGWVVRDPDGRIIENYSDWQWGSASPNDTHEFIGGRFDINKEGNWTITIVLFMNPDSPVEVARYSGSLCSVSQVIGDAEFRGLTATYSRV